MSPSHTDVSRRWWIAALAVAATWVLAILMSVRPLTSPDLGYHLAYGETFLDTGRIVDSNGFLYTLPRQSADRPTPGPGCWYDAEGRYRFPNANWLSQVVMASVHRIFGVVGLCVLQSALVAAIFGLVLWTMRRINVPYALASAGLLLTVLTAHIRFTLRPELFSYLLLMLQLTLLLNRRISWRTVVALIGLQLLFVNFHSYFLLGLGLTGAFWLDRLLPSLWPKMLRRPTIRQSGTPRTETFLLTFALAGQLIMCFVNPWTWRLAVLPIQTLVYLHVHDIAGSQIAFGGHPWSHIGELFHPFSGEFAHITATWCYRLLLVVAVIGGVAAVIRRQWGILLIIAGTAAVSLSMRRNIATAAFFVTPLALSACTVAWQGTWEKLPRGLRRNFPWIFSLIVALSAVSFGLGVVSQRFYFAERSPVRFGTGLDRLHLPIKAAEWINEQAPPGPIWSDFTSSSNFYYFTEPHRPVPILTNTWAYPPNILQRVLDISSGQRPLTEAAKRYGFDTVAVRVDRTTAPLVALLTKDSDWQIGYLDARHIVFTRTIPSSGAITSENLDVAAYIQAVGASDPVRGFALHLAGLTLYHLGWDNAAIEVFAAATAATPSYHEAWSMQGVCLAQRGQRQLRQTGHLDDLRQAARCFAKALEIKPDYQPARTNLAMAQEQLRKHAR